MTSTSSTTPPRPPTPTYEVLRSARAELARIDPALAVIDAVTPAFEWRVWEGGLPGLFKIIVGQQVSIASATAIWARIEAGLGELTAERLLAVDLDGLRALGLSSPKARYAHEVAKSVLSGQLNFALLETLSDDAAMEMLISVKGVGLWTAETYLMFCHGRTDLFPAGDVALQEAMRWADGKAVRPTREEAYARAELWRPWRGVAAHLLWAFYGGVKRGEIVRPAAS